jgi:glycosyltransferase involved in cell wall biosynthesis
MNIFERTIQPKSMEFGKPQLSIVICTYNRARYLPKALKSLEQQVTVGVCFEVIVVDNASTDDTQQVIENLIPQLFNAQFVFLQELRQGASFARNTGAQHANAPLLCFMDDDAVAYPDFVSSILHFFSQHPHAGGLGGRIVPLYVPEEPEWMSHYVSSLVGHFHYADAVVEFKGGKYPYESNMVMPTSIFHELGGFSEALPGVVGTVRIGGEGKDLFYRLAKTGRKTYYSPFVVVDHVVETAKLTPEYLARVAQGIGRGERVRTLKKSKWAYLLKRIEYFGKLIAAVCISFLYLLQGRPRKMKPLISFRIEASRGLREMTPST